MSDGTDRRLAAIVSADVVAYSRLIGADEAGTLTAFRSHRTELIDPLIAKHGGRIVKTMGDGLLLEFPSVVNAVKCVIEVQDGMQNRNVDIPEDKRIQLRIGVNLGDIVIEGDDIHGDGVNVAARLQEFCETGGVALSGIAYDGLGTLVGDAFEDAGERQFKNIIRPVRVWRWRPSKSSERAVGEETRNSAPVRNGGAVRWPERPSIAVLPFDNLSSDAEQSFFADGLAEDVITTLSKIASLFVIARNSSFAYKGRSTDIRQIARELGVRYVLEGSVRAAAGRVRVTAQLIDATDGHHIWAERYDRKVEDIFAIQDEITREIVTALRVKLSDGEQALLLLKGATNVEAWSLAMPALDLIMGGTPSGITEGRRLLERAVDADPTYASAYALNGFAHIVEAHFGFSADVGRSIEAARQSAERALSLDPDLPMAYLDKAFVEHYLGDPKSATATVNRAVQLGPNDAIIKLGAGRLLIDMGLPAAGETHLREAMRLNPFPPAYFFGVLANALEMQGKDVEAIELLRTAVTRDNNYFSGHLRLASLLALRGQMVEARLHAQEARRINPRFGRQSLSTYYKSADEGVVSRFIQGLEAAGLLLD